MSLQLIPWDRWREAIAALPHNEKTMRRVVALEGRGGELYPHIEEKYFDALLPTTRSDDAGKQGSMDILVLQDVRKGSERQMGLRFSEVENDNVILQSSSPGLREAKGRRRSNGNNRRRKKEGKQGR